MMAMKKSRIKYRKGKTRKKKKEAKEALRVSLWPSRSLTWKKINGVSSLRIVTCMCI